MRLALFILIMSKTKTSFFCQHCGHQSVKWLGQCPGCNAWNSFIEEIIQKDKGKENADWSTYGDDKKKSAVTTLDQVKSSQEKRIVTTDSELNRVLGGGIVPGSLTLIAGEPGIGKSTLFLQIGLSLQSIRVLYISGEESEQQIKMRADRLQLKHAEFYLLTETNTQTIFQEIKKLKPELVIVDSIQTLQTSYIDASAGSVSQIRECAVEFQRFEIGRAHV